MFKSLELFRMASAMASHAGRRQVVIATNMANSDTPGYRARDIKPFSETYRANRADQMQATRARHLASAPGSPDPTLFVAAGSESSPNGNAVALEDEMLKGVDARRQHDKAIAIYRSGLSILRTSLGRR